MKKCSVLMKIITEGFFKNRETLRSIQRRIYKSPTETSSTREEVEEELEVQSNFIKNEDVDTNIPTVIKKREVYDIGLLEVELFDNEYDPIAEFTSPEITPKRTFTTYKLYGESYMPRGTSIEHSLVLTNGEEVPIADANIVSQEGQVESRREYLEVDPIGQTATLRFTPLSSITIDFYAPDGIKNSVEVTAVNRIVSISNFNSKYVYEATYVISDPEISVTSSLASKEYRHETKGTSGDGVDDNFIELPIAAHVDLPIVNDVTVWRKKNAIEAKWILNLSSTPSQIDGYFWDDSLIVDNIYYGRSIDVPIFRTENLESHLYNILDNGTGDTYILVERFFQTYVGLTFSENLEYSPIEVIINKQPAVNLSSYNGLASLDFISFIDASLQYRHFDNRLLFPNALKDTDNIEVIYRIKESVVRYKSKLICNKKSEFSISPLLKSSTLVTSR